MISIRLPFWLRAVALVCAVIVVTGAGVLGYRWYAHPVTLTLAVGSIDGEGSKAMSALASQLVSTGASVRLKVVDTGTALEAAKEFAAGNVDLAVVRGDVGDLSQGQAVVVLTHATVLIIAPPLRREVKKIPARSVLMDRRTTNARGRSAYFVTM